MQWETEFNVNEIEEQAFAGDWGSAGLGSTAGICEMEDMSPSCD